MWRKEKGAGSTVGEFGLGLKGLAAQSRGTNEIPAEDTVMFRRGSIE